MDSHGESTMKNLKLFPGAPQPLNSVASSVEVVNGLAIEARSLLFLGRPCKAPAAAGASP